MNKTTSHTKSFEMAAFSQSHHWFEDLAAASIELPDNPSDDKIWGENIFAPGYTFNSIGVLWRNGLRFSLRVKAASRHRVGHALDSSNLRGGSHINAVFLGGTGGGVKGAGENTL
jgi:hypothetical protein